jgi:hypothetical protein
MRSGDEIDCGVLCIPNDLKLYINKFVKKNNVMIK